MLTPIQSHLSPHRHSILIYSLPCSILHLFIFSLLLLSVAYSFLYSFLLYLSFVFLILVHSRSFPNSPRSRTHIYILIISIKSASHVSTFAISLCNLIFLTSSPGISAFFAPYSLHSSLNSSIRSLDRHISISCLSTFTLFLRDLNILSPHVVLPHFFCGLFPFSLSRAIPPSPKQSHSYPIPSLHSIVTLYFSPPLKRTGYEH